MTDEPEWTVCAEPAVDDVLRWDEPIWAAPNKPRGARDKVGDQRITARLTAAGDVLEFEVIDVAGLDSGQARVQVRTGDRIRRKPATLARGDCHKRTR